MKKIFPAESLEPGLIGWFSETLTTALTDLHNFDSGRLNIQNAGEASSPDAEAAEAAATVLPSRLNRRHGRKGGQIRFTQQQSSQLEETFASQRYLTPGQRRSLANRLALTERQVGNPISHKLFSFEQKKNSHKKSQIIQINSVKKSHLF